MVLPLLPSWQLPRGSVVAGSHVLFRRLASDAGRRYQRQSVSLYSRSESIYQRQSLVGHIPAASAARQTGCHSVNSIYTRNSLVGHITAISQQYHSHITAASLTGWRSVRGASKVSPEADPVRLARAFTHFQGIAPSVTFPGASLFCSGRPGRPGAVLLRLAGSRMASSKQITHVLFDMDGLLLDTEGFYTTVQQAILARFGKSFDWSLKAKMMGKKALEAGSILIAETGLEGVLTPEGFIAEREAALQHMFPNSELMPGAERLIRHLHAHGVPIAIATSSHQRHFTLKSTRHTALFALMGHVVTGDHPEVAEGKPAPDIFLVAAGKFGAPPPDAARVLVFEDAPSGVQAAKNAHMNVIMVPDPNLDKSLCTEADLVLSSLLEFDPAPWGLPPFDGEDIGQKP